MVFVYLRADKFNSNGSIKNYRVRSEAVGGCGRAEQKARHGMPYSRPQHANTSE
jgi:hypothetical protein